ncbi:uncharacterized protein A4U43_C04F33180 [Asparagus officinalis]|uniref:Uncharacterized protein n=1 Tax=Asparagus officinalis TaxID=4686 RepID=A0A5P1F5D4_ASPOF|nr:uncharacterized protein A4U43_C04F33180 [Asparagus officinalis]
MYGEIVKLLDIYRNRHNISVASGLNDPVVATGISDLIYESKETHKDPGSIDPDLAMAWAEDYLTRALHLSN